MNGSKCLWAVLVALIVGFILAYFIWGRKPSTSTLQPKQVTVGQVLTWEPLDEQIGVLRLAIPKALCDQVNGGTDPRSYASYNSVSVTSEVTCVVRPQDAGPITYFYKYKILDSAHKTSQKTVKAPDVANAATDTANVTVVMDIVGSCDQCDTTTPQLAADTEIDAGLECQNNAPAVIDESNGSSMAYINIPSSVRTVVWTAQGGLGTPTITFDDAGTPKPLCTLSNPNPQVVKCTITGNRDGADHKYTVSLPRCNKGTPADNFVLHPEVQSPTTPPVQPQ